MCLNYAVNKLQLLSFFTISLLCCMTLGHAQGVNRLSFTNVVPPSPEVSAFGKYLEFPMNHSSGVPVISIPIYTARSGSLALPISLSYNASGIKVEEVASWAGLGWSLNVGPSLYRVVHGQPDDFSMQNGFMYTSSKANLIYNYPENSTEKTQAYNRISTDELDVEPDIYYFSVLGYSGKFYYDQEQGAFVQLPKSAIKITHRSNSNGKIVQWTITLPDGTSCFFGQTEDLLRSAYDSLLSSSTISFPNTILSSGNGAPEHISVWQPMELKHPQGSKMEFFYATVSSVDFGRGGETTDYLGLSGCTYADGQLKYSTYANSGSKSVLQKIAVADADIEFVASSIPREDIINGGAALSRINIKGKDGQLVKAFRLNTSYWTSDAESNLIAVPNPLVGNPQVVAGKRLYLASLEVLDREGISQERYSFDYNDKSLPNRLSAAQDYWGYYNRAANGICLSPKIKASLVNGATPGSGYLAGADRRIDTLYAQARVLTSITHPTGGKTEYFYESNRVPESGIALGDVNQFQFSALEQKTFFFSKSPSYLEQGSTTTYSRNFSVGKNPTYIDFEYTGCNNNMATFDCPINITIQGISDPSFNLMLVGAKLSYSLPEGNYKISATISSSSETSDPDFAVGLSWEEEKSGMKDQIIVGGLRLKKMITTDGLSGRMIRTYSYNQFSTPSKSSGHILNLPMHIFDIFCGRGNEMMATVTRRVSYSAAPLNGGDGQTIRYTHITEYSDDEKQQKTEYVYSHDLYDFTSSATNSYPFPTVIYRDWRSGLLQKQITYEYLETGRYRPVLSKQITYKEYEEQSKLAGLKHSSTPNPGSFSIGRYNIWTEWYLKTAEIDTAYFYGESGVSKIIQQKAFSYDKNNFYMQTDVWQKRSDGKSMHQRLSYPKDHNNSAGFNVDALLNRHIIGLPIRKENHVGNKIIDGEIIKYNEIGLPIASYVYEGTDTDTVALNSSLVVPSYYVLNYVLAYDGPNIKKAVEVSKEKGQKECFLWGYREQYPVANIKNADYATVVAALGGQAVVDAFAASNPTDAEVKSFLMPLKAGLPNAFITSYTYKPLVGMTSQTDAKGMTTYFEYDSFQRLKYVKDQNGNIIKSYTYYLKN